MQHRRQGFGTTLLMLVPMMGVPAMAIFGVPQVAPFLSSQTSHADDAELPEFLESRVGNSASGTQRQVEVATPETLDIFRPYGEATTNSDSVETKSWTDPLATSNASRSQLQRPDAATKNASVKSARQVHQQVYDIFGDDFGTGGKTPAKSQSEPLLIPSPRTRQVSLPVEQSNARNPITWRQAIDRLNSFGPLNYRLTNGVQPDDYLFVCHVPSTDDSRITRRFEAEAKEPLDAVAQVLGQIEQWVVGR